MGMATAGIEPSIKQSTQASSSTSFPLTRIGARFCDVTERHTSDTATDHHPVIS